MAFDFLVPIEDKVLAHCELLPPQALGKNIFKHTERKGLPVLANATIAIFGVHESRNAFEKKMRLKTISSKEARFSKICVCFVKSHLSQRDFCEITNVFNLIFK